MATGRIGIDFHVAGGIYQGVRTYLTNLIEELVKLESDFTYFVYTGNPGEFADWQKDHNNITLRNLPGSSGYYNLLAGFSTCVVRDGLSLFHSQYILPIYLSCKSILTIHDILFESHPEFFPYFHRMLMKWLVPYSARRAHGIISVSEFTKKEIVKYYGIPEDRITVIYEGASDAFAPISDEALIFNRLKKFGIETRYVLFVGRIEPRKNLSSVLKAFEYLRKRGHKEVRLVVVGNQDKIFKEKSLFSEIRERGLDSDVVFTGGISEQDLCALYNGAEAFAYPAYAEGFGLPVVEAMSCGTPVITSNTTALAEVAGDAAMLVDPRSFLDLGQALERVLDDQMLRKELSAKGLARAKMFSWKRAADETAGVYKKVVQQ